MENKRKAVCGFCGKTLERGEGTRRLGNITKQPFYVCIDGCKGAV